MEFQEFPKIARLSRECVITEKIDGTNAQVVIEHAELITDWGIAADVPWLKRVGDLAIAAASRTRYITPHADNHGWARWVADHAEDLIRLGPGRHFGEWWGSGIQRGYGLQNGEKRFSLFNTSKWSDDAQRPSCCHVTPILYTGMFDTMQALTQLERLRVEGSLAAPGFMKPEGIVLFHMQGNVGFKKTIERDDEHKFQQR